jgi:hypothetical protein
MTTCTRGMRRATGDRIAELAARGLTDSRSPPGSACPPHGWRLYRIFPKLEVTTRVALRDALRLP